MAAQINTSNIDINIFENHVRSALNHPLHRTVYIPLRGIPTASERNRQASCFMNGSIVKGLLNGKSKCSKDSIRNQARTI